MQTIFHLVKGVKLLAAYSSRGAIRINEIMLVMFLKLGGRMDMRNPRCYITRSFGVYRAIKFPFILLTHCFGQ